MQLHTCVNPAFDVHLTVLRRKETPTDTFRRHADIAMAFLWSTFFSSFTREELTRPVPIETPLCQTSGYEFSMRCGLVPVLRSGIPLAEIGKQFFPDAPIYHLGMERHHTTLQPSQYLNKLPKRTNCGLLVVCEPMFATGGSACASFELIKQRYNPEQSGLRVALLSLISAPEAIAKTQAEYPYLDRVVIGAQDPRLTSNGYIDPGLGDFGDRYYGTLAEAA